MEQNIKISQLPASETLDGFSALGVSADNATVKVDMSFVQQAADNANTATASAVAATEDAIAATTAATEATALTEAATSEAITATTAANTAAQSVNDVKAAATTAAAAANTAATLAAENAELAGTNASRADQSATRATAAAVGVEEAIANTEAATVAAITATDTIDSKIAAKADLIYVDQQLATKAAAIDYSSLIEQIVPGEFWSGKQVYYKSVIGIGSYDLSETILIRDVAEYELVKCDVRFVNGMWGLKPNVTRTYGGYYDVFNFDYAAHGNLRLAQYGTSTAGMAYNLTFKYTKL